MLQYNIYVHIILARLTAYTVLNPQAYSFMRIIRVTVWVYVWGDAVSSRSFICGTQLLADHAALFEMRRGRYCTCRYCYRRWNRR